MSLETFIEKFEVFADAPGAVTKMRQLVLELAVQGKLVERRDSDGFSAKIFSEGLPPEAESRYKIAENWIWIRFAAVGEQRLGKMLDQKANRGELKPYLRNTNVQWMRLQLDDIKELRLESGELEEYRLLPGDLLICEGGEPGRCAIWRDANREMYFQKAIHRVRPRNGILSEYLAICLQVNAQNGVLAKHFTGATIKHFSGRSLSQYSIPLPPLAEQKRIVAKVDELMALCDRLEAQQQERETRHAALARASLARFADAPTPANLDFLFHSSFSIQPSNLRKSILTLAVQGKLVPQDTNDEPAIALLDQIAAHKAALAKEGKLRGSTSVKPMAGDEAEFEIPSNWCWVRFGQIMVNRDGERIPVSKEEREIKAKTYDYYGASGIIDKIDGYLFDKPLLLIGEDGANLINRSTPIAFIARGKYWVNNHAHVLDGISEDFLQFIKLHINAINLEKYITGSAQPKMNQAKMNSIPIALPPLAEQRRIVAKVDQLMALVDALETQLAASRASAANLLEALVAELTAQV